MWTLGSLEGLGLLQMQIMCCKWSKWKTTGSGAMNYLSKQRSPMTAIELKVKLLERNCAFPFCFTGKSFTAGGALSRCNDSQKNVMFNEPNMEIIMPVIFRTYTK